MINSHKLQHGICISHIGAGSIKNYEKYRLLLEENYKHLYSFQTDSILELVTQSLSHLEDSELVNAGSGSNLNAHGEAECDSSILSVTAIESQFYSVCSLAGIKNPFAVAKELFLADPKRFFYCKKPRILCGNGAQQFALEAGAFSSYKQNANAVAEYERSISRFRDLQENCSQPKYSFLFNSNTSSSNLPELLLDAKPNDTIGSACLTATAAVIGCSTGGPLLKPAGRIGHVSIPGCASWANISDSGISVGCMSSGNGEELLQTRLCASLGSILMSTSSETVLRALFKKHTHYEFGIVGCKLDFKLGVAEIVTAHTTPNFAYSFFIVKDGKFSEQVIEISTRKCNRKDFYFEIKSIRF